MKDLIEKAARGSRRGSAGAKRRGVRGAAAAECLNAGEHGEGAARNKARKEPKHIM